MNAGTENPLYIDFKKEVKPLKKHIKAILITIGVILAVLVLLHLTINILLPQIAAMHGGMF